MGQRFYRYDEVSAKWLETCRRFILANGPVFTACWGRELQHVETKLTSENGAALATFFVDGNVACSALYLSGIAPASDSEAAQLFIDSMRRIELVEKAAADAFPFASIATTADRPLCVHVLWCHPNVADANNEMILQLALHFGGAFVRLHQPD